MREVNQSATTDFILLGVTGQQEQEDIFFILFLFIYPITLVGNMLIILAIVSDVHLHNPMYFFLANLSLVDIFFSSATIPKMLTNHLLGNKAISYVGCFMQMDFMLSFGNTDSYILAAMAISRPLHYTTIMRPSSCVLMVVGSWAVAINSFPHTLLTASLSFCGNKKVAKFYCDIAPLLKLSCSDIHFNVKMMYLGVGIFSVPLLCIIISYARVFATVLRVPSTKGILKAFSTCGSHLTVVSLYYGIVMGMYFRPLTSYSLKDAIITVMYMAVTPMLNPFIYSLRNQDMKAALGKLLNRSSYLCCEVTPWMLEALTDSCPMLPSFRCCLYLSSLKFIVFRNSIIFRSASLFKLSLPTHFCSFVIVTALNSCLCFCPSE